MTLAPKGKEDVLRRIVVEYGQLYVYIYMTDGNGKILDNGQVRALDVKIGDKVLFGKYSGTEVKVDGVEYLVMREDDIMAILG